MTAPVLHAQPEDSSSSEDGPPSSWRSAARRSQRRVVGAGALLVLATLLLYLLTLDNGLRSGELVGGDLITHQYAQVQGRPSNAPGYPLYTMGGWLWFHGLRSLLRVAGTAHPNPLPILSSYSTLWALLAVGLLYATLCRITRSARWPAGHWPLAWLLAAFYAVTYFFWYYATTTEQYTSAIAQTLAIFYVYLLWRDAVRQERSAANRQLSLLPSPFTIHNSQFTIHNSQFLLVFLAFLCGLSLAHMLTVAFIVPPLVIAVLWEQPSLLRNWRMILLCIAAALLPLLSYVYVYVRGAAHPEWWGEGNWHNAQEWFWTFVSTRQGRKELSRGFEAGRAFFGNGFPEMIWHELSLPFVVLGTAGVAFLGRKPAFVLYGTLGIYLIFDWIYRYGNWFQVILPAYPLLLVGVGAALDRWDQYWAGQEESKERSGQAKARKMGVPLLRYVPYMVLVTAVVWRFAASWEAANSHDRPEATGLNRAAVWLDQPLPEGAGLFAPVEDALALDYLINIWGIRPDLRVVSSEEAGNLLRAGERPVLTTFEAASALLNELAADVQPWRQALSPDWLLLQSGKAQPVARPAVVVDQVIARDTILHGYTTRNAPTGAPVTTADPAIDVTLFWQLAGIWPEDVSISLRPTRRGAFIADPGATDGAIVQRDASELMQGLMPAPGQGQGIHGQNVIDAYRVPMPEGADGVDLIVYRQTDSGFENLFALSLSLTNHPGQTQPNSLP